MKSDDQLEQDFLKGVLREAQIGILRGAGHNARKILAPLSPLLRLLLARSKLKQSLNRPSRQCDGRHGDFHEAIQNTGYSSVIWQLYQGQSVRPGMLPRISIPVSPDLVVPGM